jgi:hypothetical protein
MRGIQDSSFLECDALTGQGVTDFEKDHNGQLRLLDLKLKALRSFKSLGTSPNRASHFVKLESSRSTDISSCTMTNASLGELLNEEDKARESTVVKRSVRRSW